MGLYKGGNMIYRLILLIAQTLASAQTLAFERMTPFIRDSSSAASGGLVNLENNHITIQMNSVDHCKDCAAGEIPLNGNLGKESKGDWKENESDWKENHGDWKENHGDWKENHGGWEESKDKRRENQEDWKEN